MKVFRFKPLSVCDTNSFVVTDSMGSCVLIDAPDDAEYILEQLGTLGLTLDKILLTHGHFDHIGAVADLVEKTECEVYIHPNDLQKLKEGDAMLGRFFGASGFKPVHNALTFEDGSVITEGDLEFTVLYTPGHTSGSCCFMIEDALFTGDTLFRRSIGRTDMPDGDYAAMKRSLEKLYYLDGSYTVYPGHMDNTTLEEERHYNPYLSHLGDF